MATWNLAWWIIISMCKAHNMLDFIVKSTLKYKVNEVFITWLSSVDIFLVCQRLKIPEVSSAILIAF